MQYILTYYNGKKVLATKAALNANDDGLTFMTNGKKRVCIKFPTTAANALPVRIKHEGQIYSMGYVSALVDPVTRQYNYGDNWQATNLDSSYEWRVDFMYDMGVYIAYTLVKSNSNSVYSYSYDGINWSTPSGCTVKGSVLDSNCSRPDDNFIVNFRGFFNTGAKTYALIASYDYYNNTCYTYETIVEITNIENMAMKKNRPLSYKESSSIVKTTGNVGNYYYDNYNSKICININISSSYSMIWVPYVYDLINDTSTLPYDRNCTYAYVIGINEKRHEFLIKSYNNDDDIQYNTSSAISTFYDDPPILTGYSINGYLINGNNISKNGNTIYKVLPYRIVGYDPVSTYYYAVNLADTSYGTQKVRTVYKTNDFNNWTQVFGDATITYSGDYLGQLMATITTF